ncbi:MAG: antibiotic biosynthesis monooxygenase [Duncaniella sp.]|nr:antibiotic biosynthesis monooxygenase [Duncaniella sp.]
MVSIAKITVDPYKVEEYRRILKEEIMTSLLLEEDVHVLYPVWDKEQPNQFTIVEVYKDKEAYDRHCQSPHLLKYFEETKDIVLNLEISEAIPMFDNLYMK